MSQQTKKIFVRPDIRENGIGINIDGDYFSIIYPKNIWTKYPSLAQKNLSENLVFAMTLHLPYISDINFLDYQMSKPRALKILRDGFRLSLPSSALMQARKTSELLKKFSEIEYHFNYRLKTKDGSQYFRKIARNVAVLPFTFGKDSLLTFGLCNEIGIKTLPIFIKEPLAQIENFQKEKLAEKFLKEFKKKILFIENGAGKLREQYKEKSDEGWYGWELQLTQFSLILLPIVFSKRARYLFFSNEQSCNDKFLDKEKIWCNPVYEQSSEWTLKLREIAKILEMGNLKIGSLMEPIHEIAVTRILHHRYPKIAKYQMSCGADLPAEKKYRWCENCSKCARVYIFLLANNVNPSKVGIKNNLLELRYKDKFSLFGSWGSKEYGTDTSGLNRDEQLLAFYLAYKNGYKGQLINLFKKLYLKEVKTREKELREKYFGIHSISTIPEELKDKILGIFRKELRGSK